MFCLQEKCLEFGKLHMLPFQFHVMLNYSNKAIANNGSTDWDLDSISVVPQNFLILRCCFSHLKQL